MQLRKTSRWIVSGLTDRLEVPQCQSTRFFSSFPSSECKVYVAFMPTAKSTSGCGSRSLNHVSISTKFLPRLLRIKRRPRIANGDRDAVNAVFSLQGLCAPPALRRIPEQICEQEGNGWVKVSPISEHKSCPVFTFSKSGNPKKDWDWKIPRQTKSLIYIPWLYQFKPFWARRSNLTLLPCLPNKSTYFVGIVINCVQVS